MRTRSVSGRAISTEASATVGRARRRSTMPSVESRKRLASSGARSSPRIVASGVKLAPTEVQPAIAEGRAGIRPVQGQAGQDDHQQGQRAGPVEPRRGAPDPPRRCRHARAPDRGRAASRPPTAQRGRSAGRRRPRTAPALRSMASSTIRSASAAEGVAAGRGHGREEADRGEPGDGVDLRQVQPVRGQQEVDPGEALGPDRPVAVPGDLEDRRPGERIDLGGGRRLGQARGVLRGVVVELVAGHDLAGAVQLEPGRVVADDRHLEVARAGQVRLGQDQRVVGQGRLDRGRSLGGVVGQGHPDRAAQPGRLDHQPRVAGPGGERLELDQDPGRVGRPARGAHLAPVADRQPEPAAQALEDGLVHAQRRRGHPEPV